MRTGIVAAALVLALVLALEGSAQQQPGGWAGTNPRNITFQPIDTSRALKPSATDKAFRNPAQLRTPGIERFFPKFNVATWPPKIPNVFVMDQKANQFQPNPPKGYNPFVEAAKNKK